MLGPIAHRCYRKDTVRACKIAVLTTDRHRNGCQCSTNGTLARYRVLHFARLILKARAEPALILTPPDDGGTGAALEEDASSTSCSSPSSIGWRAPRSTCSRWSSSSAARGPASGPWLSPGPTRLHRPASSS